MLSVRLCSDRATWDSTVNRLGGHPLQLWGWGEVKSKHNWNVERVLVLDGEQAVGACQILLRKVTGFGEAILYAPRGPVWSAGRGDDVMEALIGYAKRSKRGIVFTVEPAGRELPLQRKFREAHETILMSHTLMIDLTLGEEKVLANMMKNHRYYIRKAVKDPSIEIRRVTTLPELDEVLKVYHSTAARDDFALHSDEYYRDIMRDLGDDSVLFAGYKNGEPIAFVWDAVSDSTAFELYGGANEAGRKARVNYPLKWAAIKHALERGCTLYDMNGLLNEGISGFKAGFAHDHESDDLVGTWDLPLSPLYVGYRNGLPLAKQGIRALAQVRREGLRAAYRDVVAPARPAFRQLRARASVPFRQPDPAVREDATGDDARES